MALLDNRATEAEVMDDLNCSGEVLDQTLRELEFINKWLGGNNVTLHAIGTLFKSLPKDRTYDIADLGCGGGDMAAHILKWGRHHGYRFHITGIDANPNVVRFANQNVSDETSIKFKVMNVFSEEFSNLKFDVVVGTLFFHHLSREELISFFSLLKKQVKIGLIINDIHRHALAYHSIKMLTALFSKSEMVKYDAPLSVRRAFTRNELQEVMTSAGYENFTIRWKWAFRWEVIAKTA
jgi:2-polyprenyl-3-methyl-5-hydroxy-6-metoxy-1,4-benzoquinol methylase